MIAVTCAGCHGTDGAGGSAIPPLKGRDAAYMTEALLGYKNDSRPGSIMPRIAKGYTEDELKAVAEYFAALQD
ncbi:MAG: c-type cytochrome [Thiolinea sp.]